MGGLEFFCTTIETPEGDVELLQMAMTAMNAQPDPEAEDRKGCSGHVGKMIFSTSVEQLAIVAYVPAAKKEKIDITEWVQSVLTAVGGTVMMRPPMEAVSPGAMGPRRSKPTSVRRSFAEGSEALMVPDAAAA